MILRRLKKLWSLRTQVPATAKEGQLQSLPLVSYNVLYALEQCTNGLVTIDLTGDDDDGGKDNGGKDVGGSDHGDVAPVTTKPAERLIIDLTDDD